MNFRDLVVIGLKYYKVFKCVLNQSCTSPERCVWGPALKSTLPKIIDGLSFVHIREMIKDIPNIKHVKDVQA